MKLTAQDLMIGDWVLYNNEPNIIAEVSEIIQGEAEVCFAVSNYMANIDEIKPFPITPEILIKSGFKDCHTIGEKYELRINLDEKIGGEYQVVSYYFACGELKIKTEYSYYMRPTIESLRINYVHQLQQAMRLCKIRKEIVL